MAEQVDAEVQVVHRHESPRFEQSDWSFLDEAMRNTVRTRGWYRRLPQASRDAVNDRAHLESRVRLEPWLAPRLAREEITVWPRRTVVRYRELSSGEIEVTLSSGERLLVDHVLLATGYKFDVARIPYLAASGLIDDIQRDNGFPFLDEDFQTSVEGLFLTGRVASKAFGPNFGFVGGAPAAARIIVKKLLASND